MIKWFNLYNVNGRPKTYYFFKSEDEAKASANEDKTYIGTFSVDIKEKVTKYMIVYKDSFYKFTEPNFNTEADAQNYLSGWLGERPWFSKGNDLIVIKVEYEQ